MRLDIRATFLAATLLFTLPAAAGAQSFAPGAIATGSPPATPLVDPCPDQPEKPPEQINFESTEVEPQVAVDPTDNDNVIGVFQQDRWSDGGAHGLLAAVSHDGGVTYGNNWAEFSSCSDIASTPYREPLPRATDPWVSFDAAGRAYQIALPIVDGGFEGGSAITASYSTDAGDTWSDPVDLIRDEPDPTGVTFNDKQSITADPNRADVAYATWIRGDLPGEDLNIFKLSHSFAYRGLPMFSKTTDGGVSWSTPKPMTTANVYAQGNQIAVLPNGTLVDVQAILAKGSGIQPTPRAYFIGVQRSSDNGRHWSPVTRVAPLGYVQPAADGKDLRVGDYLPDITVDRGSGDIYVTWTDPMGGSTQKVVLSRSIDNGKTWSRPVMVSHHPAAHSFNHAVAVAQNDGDVAVLYMDIARNVAGGADGIPTDVYLRHAERRSDGSLDWQAPVLLDSFDFAKAPVARGLFVGDYMGLEARDSNDLIALYGSTENYGETTSPANSANVISMQLNRP
jgi:hypothetical protein